MHEARVTNHKLHVFYDNFLSIRTQIAHSLTLQTTYAVLLCLGHMHFLLPKQVNVDFYSVILLNGDTYNVLMSLMPGKDMCF